MYRQTTSSFGQPVNLTLQPSPTKHGTLFIVQSVMTWVAYILMLLYTPWKPQISSKHVHAQFQGQNHSRVPLERLGQRWAICCVKAFPIWYLFSDSSGVISRGLCLHSTHDLPRLPHRHCKNCVSSASRHPWPLQAALGCTCPCCCYPCNMFVVVAGIVIFTFCSTAIDIAMFVTLKQKQYTYKYKYTIYIYISIYIHVILIHI